MNSNSTIKKAHQGRKSSAKKQWKWPEGKPRRPKSAYNYFFSQERQKLLQERKHPPNSSSSSSNSRKSNGLGFSNLAKIIAAKWKLLDDQEKEKFQAHADNDTARYEREIAAWQNRNKEKQQCESGTTAEQAESSISSNTVIHVETFESLRRTSALIEQRIQLLTEAIKVSQQQVSLLSEQVGTVHISPAGGGEGSCHKSITSNNENPDNATLYQCHLPMRNEESLSNSIQSLQEEESFSGDRSSNDSSMLMLDDILALSEDICMDGDTIFEDSTLAPLFEELD